MKFVFLAKPQSPFEYYEYRCYKQKKPSVACSLWVLQQRLSECYFPHLCFPNIKKYKSPQQWASVVQLLSRVWLFVTPWTAACQVSLSFTTPWSLLRLMSIETVMLSHPVIPLSSCPQSFSMSRSFPMSQLFPSGGQSTGASASASVLPMNIQGLVPLGLITYLLAAQGTLKSLLQHHSSKESIQCSTFFIVQLSHPYMTTGKTIALTIQTFVGKVILL